MNLCCNILAQGYAHIILTSYMETTFRPDFYNKHHLINITKDYKIVNETLVDVVNKEAAVIAAKLDIENKVETMSKTKAFISIKDHKNDFENNPKFRLINPAKSQIGHISREILQITNKLLRRSTELKKRK